MLVAYAALGVSLLTIAFLYYKLRSDRQKTRFETTAALNPVVLEAEKMQAAVNSMVEQVRILASVVQRTSDPAEKAALLERLRKMEAILEKFQEREEKTSP